jgi:ABC-type lipoprotein export system ATPase subunit
MAERDVETLSGAERRWVAIARALSRSDASILIADEPGAELDSDALERVGELLEQERDLGKTVLVLSRAPEIAGLRGSRVAFLDGGRISLEARASWPSAARWAL